MTSKPPYLRAGHTDRQSAIENEASHGWIMPGSLRLGRQYIGRQPRTDLLRLHALEAPRAGHTAMHLNAELPALYRYTFQPGSGRHPTLVDVWHCDTVPASVEHCQPPYYLALIHPPNLVRSLHEIGFVFFYERS